MKALSLIGTRIQDDKRLSGALDTILKICQRVYDRKSWPRYWIDSECPVLSLENEDFLERVGYKFGGKEVLESFGWCVQMTSQELVLDKFKPLSGQIFIRMLERELKSLSQSERIETTPYDQLFLRGLKTINEISALRLKNITGTQYTQQDIEDLVVLRELCVEILATDELGPKRALFVQKTLQNVKELLGDGLYFVDTREKQREAMSAIGIKVPNNPDANIEPVRWAAHFEKRNRRQVHGHPDMQFAYELWARQRVDTPPPKSEQHLERSLRAAFRPDYVGLTNIAYSRTLNSLLQTYFMIYPIRYYVLKTPCDKPNDKFFAVLYELRKLFIGMMVTTLPTISPTPLLEVLFRGHQTLAIGATEDVHEINSTLLNCLHQTIKAQHPNFIPQFFSSQVSQQKFGPNLAPRKKLSLRHIFMDISFHSDLFEALDSLTCPAPSLEQETTNVDNDFDDSYYSFDSLPQILVFQFTRAELEKTKETQYRPFKFPQILKMNRYLTQNAQFKKEKDPQVQQLRLQKAALQKKLQSLTKATKNETGLDEMIDSIINYCNVSNIDTSANDLESLVKRLRLEKAQLESQLKKIDKEIENIFKPLLHSKNDNSNEIETEKKEEGEESEKEEEYVSEKEASEKEEEESEKEEEGEYESEKEAKSETDKNKNTSNTKKNDTNQESHSNQQKGNTTPNNPNQYTYHLQSILMRSRDAAYEDNWVYTYDHEQRTWVKMQNERVFPAQPSEVFRDAFGQMENKHTQAREGPLVPKNPFTYCLFYLSHSLHEQTKALNNEKLQNLISQTERAQILEQIDPKIKGYSSNTLFKN